MCYNCKARETGKNDVSTYAKRILQQVPCELQVIKRRSTPIEYRVICNLLNDGTLVTEIKDNKEYIDVVEEPEYPYLL